jgi:hypothetical protein
MSIINSASSGSQINLLCLMYRVIHRNNGAMTADELQKLCRPEYLPTKTDHEKRFGENFRFWMDESHQLWKENEESKVELLRPRDSATPDDISGATWEALLSQRYDNIFKPKTHDVTPLFRSLGAILVSDQFTATSNRLLDNVAIDELFGRYLPNYTPNTSEKPYVLAYGHFLGFLEAAPKGKYVVDVTRAVRRIIDDVFGDQSRLACKEFLSRLGHHIPLLDGGEYRHQIEAKMTKGNEEREPEHSISGVLSLALERLRYAGQLHFELFADDPDSYRLTIPGERRAISSISLSDSEGVQ